jgi:uncharacterized protein YaiL (DUF2058 family)
MAESLKDQLLKAGLVSKQQVRNVEAEKRKGAKKGAPAPVKESAEAARRAQAEKAERDRELNRKREEEAEKKAAGAAIKQLIEANRIEKRDGEVPFNFIDGSKVRRVYVTPELHAQLVQGALCVAKLAGKHELVPRETAEKIQARDPNRVIIPAPAAPETPAEDDPYAAYKVPDDLIW